MKSLLTFLILSAAFLSAQNVRVDGVVQSRTGAPAPGATLAVCTQPANTSTVPCSPLAKLCSSVNDGVCAALNPITTDGLGNYFFYIASGLYTYQFYGSGLTTRVLPDQSVGGQSSGGTSTTFSLSVAPSSVMFGTVQNGTASQPAVVTITNTGTGSVIVTGAAFTTGTKFTSPNLNACNGVLPAGAACSLLVSYAPLASVTDNDTLTFTSNAPIDPQNPLTVALSGTGSAGATFPVTLTGFGAGGGTVIDTNNANSLSGTFVNGQCSGICTFNYASGATVILTATANQGSTFSTFGGAGLTTSPGTFTVTQAQTVSSTFNLTSATSVLTVGCTDQGSGTIVSDVGGINVVCAAGQATGTTVSNPLAQGTVITLTETPSPSCSGGACTFIKWIGSQCTNASTCPVTLTSNTTVTADFALPFTPVSLIQKISGGTTSSASIAFVQCATNSANAGATSITTSITTTAGNFLMAFTKASNSVTWTLTDNLSHTWTQTVSGYVQDSTNQEVADMRYRANAAAISSVTASFNGSIGQRELTVCEVSGIASTSPEDTSGNTSGSSIATSLTSNAFTTTNANDILFYGVGTVSVTSAQTAGASFTIPSGASGSWGSVQYRIVAATQTGVTTSMSWTNGSRSAAVLGAFKAGSGNNITGTFASAQNVGDFAVCNGMWNDNTTTVSGVTDSSGNTWTQVTGSPKTNTAMTLVQYYAKNIAAASAGANVVTFALTAAPSVRKLECIEYSGINTSTALDTSVGATGNSATPSSGAATTTVSNDLLIGTDNVSSSISAVSPSFTQQILVNGSDTEDFTAPSAAPYTFAPTQASSGVWTAILSAFKTSGVVSTTFTVSITSALGSGSGTITGSGFNCTITPQGSSGTCSQIVASGTVLNLNANPGAGSVFNGYQGAGCSVTPACTTIAIVNNVGIAATFLLSGTGNYFVNHSTGSDSADGLSATVSGGHGPWLTIQHAVNAFVLGPTGTTITVANAMNYPETVNVNRGGSSPTVRLAFKCSGSWTVGGSNCTGTQWNITTASNVDIGSPAKLGFEYSNANTTYAVDVIWQCGTAVTCAYGNSIHVLGNYFHDISQSAGTPTGCPGSAMILIQNHHGSLVSDAQVIGNLLDHFGNNALTNCQTAHDIYLDTSNGIVENNIALRAATSGIQIYDAACNTVISNNVSANNAKYGLILDGSNQCTQGLNTVVNNVFSNNPVAFYTGSSGTASCTASTPTKWANNIIFGSAPVYAAGPASCDQISGEVSENPTATFVSYTGDATGDYRLKGTSIAVNGGTTTCVSGGQTPCVPSLDFLNVSRPQRTNWDIGAFELP